MNTELTRLRAPLGEILERRAVEFADSLLLRTIDLDGQVIASYTYDEFNRYVNRLAHGFSALGLVAGDHAVIMLANSAEHLAVQYALVKLGVIKVEINVDFRGIPLEHTIKLTGSAVLITENQYLEPIAESLNGLGQLKNCVLTDRAASIPTSLQGLDFRVLNEVASSREENPDQVVTDDLMPEVIVFTSGSTGLSKGCILSHRRNVCSALAAIECLGLNASDRLFTPYPVYHVGFQASEFLPMLLVGGSAVIAPRFSASRFWQQVSDNGITWLTLQGSVSRILWDRESEAIEREHKLRITWGTPLLVDAEEWKARFGHPVLTEGLWGMSETGIALTSAPLGSKLRGGAVRSTHEIKVVNDADESMPNGESGEIVVRPREPGVIFDGYFGNDEATVKAWRHLWFHTGDLGRFNSDGRLEYLGRSSGRVRVRGHQVSTTEVEQAIIAHEGVAHCVVLGSPSAMGDEDLHAFIELHSEMAVTEIEVRAHLQGKLARYMMPTSITFLSALPKTGTGKYAIGELRALVPSTVNVEK